jgi:hypothetical protein
MRKRAKVYEATLKERWGLTRLAWSWSAVSKMIPAIKNALAYARAF